MVNFNPYPGPLGQKNGTQVPSFVLIMSQERKCVQDNEKGEQGIEKKRERERRVGYPDFLVGAT